MKKLFVKMFGCAALAVASIVALNACSGENGVDGKDGKDGVDGKDGASVTDTLYVVQKDTVIFAGDTIYISKKDTVVIDNRDTVYIGNGGSGSGNGGAGTGDNTSFGTLVDERDGQTYRTTKIGDQVWMAENLNYAYNVPTESRDSSSFCYDNDPANCQKYGRLYPWSAAMDSAGVLKNDGEGKGCGDKHECGVKGPIQGICPKGWHLPSKEEFDKLFAFVGDDADDKLKAESGWLDEKNGMDLYDYSALPAGRYISITKGFSDLGKAAYFWSSTEYWFAFADYLGINDYGAKVYDDPNLYLEYFGSYGKFGAFSVRCLKD